MVRMSDLGMEGDAMVSQHRPICARRSAPDPALCGAPGFSTLWTNQRRYVDCAGCIAEIERRLADPAWRARAAAPKR
jgi:hypothetical protein